MAERAWVKTQVFYCDHAGEQVSIETEMVFPNDILPETPPQRRAQRCSHSMTCNLLDKPSCVWAGTNPLYDPTKH